MNFKDELRVVREEFIKGMRITLAYPIELVGYIVFPVVWVLPFFFQGKAFTGGLHSAAFKISTGTAEYLPYVLTGAIVSTYLFSSLYGMAGSLRLESFWGTLELIFASPARKLSILIGKALHDSCLASIIVFSQCVICGVFFGLKITLHTLFPVLVVFLLLILGLYGIALALAGITLQIKEVRSLTRTVEYFFFIFSPIRYPVEVNPVTHFFSLLVPITYALGALRGLTLLSAAHDVVMRNILVLAVMDVVCIAFGIYVFYFVENKTRKSGSISFH